MKTAPKPQTYLVTRHPRDAALTGEVAQALRSVPELRLKVIPFEGHQSRVAPSSFALLLVHVALPEDAVEAAALIRSAASQRQLAAVVVIGDGGCRQAGLDLVRQGAANYFERPLDPHQLARQVALLTAPPEGRGRDETPAPAPNSPAGCAGRSDPEDNPSDATGVPVARTGPAGQFLYSTTGPSGSLMERIRRVAPVETSVLIQGETGVGKTLLARIIHDLSPRRSRPFLVVDCATLSATLIESELFGHVKGSFTGAERTRVGKFAAVEDGTLFLDEVESLPPDLQGKLLRVTEDRAFVPVGTNAPQPMRARLITASNRPLGREVEAGRFRIDLFYRLNVVTFSLPPLRERLELLPALAGEFVAALAGRAGRAITGISPEAIAALKAHHWPGNIRELRNAIEQAVALRTEGRIELDDLPETVRAAGGTAAPPGRTLAGTKAEAEAARIVVTLRKNRNNRRRTAAELGISRMTLYNKLHRYHLTEPAD